MNRRLSRASHRLPAFPNTGRRRPLTEALEDRRLFAAGDLDASFGGIRSFGLPGQQHVVVDLDVRNNKTVMAVESTVIDSNGTRQQVHLVQLLPNGAFDTSFDGDGRLLLSDLTDVGGLIVQSDGRIVVTGTLYNGRGAVGRINGDATVDNTFVRTDSTIHSFRSLPFTNPTAPRLTASGGKVVVGGFSELTRFTGNFQAARLNANGTYDTSFASTGIVTVGNTPGAVNQIAVQADGKVLVGGYYRDSDTDVGSRLLRLNSNGSVDAGFKQFNSATTDADLLGAVEVAGDGRIYVAVNTSGFVTSSSIVRLATNGNVIDTFAGITGAPFGEDSGSIYDLRIASDGKVVGFGRYDPYFLYNGTVATRLSDAIFRWDADGTFDYTWGGGRGFVQTDGASVGDLYADNRPVGGGGSQSLVRAQRRIYAETETAAGIRLSPEGFLSVEGTNNNDTIYVTADADRVRVLSRGVVKYFPRASVNRIIVNGAAGNDLIKVDAFQIPSFIHGGAGNDTLTGGAAEDDIFGAAGNDIIRGLGGNDRIGGGVGDDVIDGGVGRDVLAGGNLTDEYGNPATSNGNDTLTYETRTNAVTVLLAADGLTGTGGESGEQDAVYGFRTVIGGKGNDTIKAYKDGTAAMRLLGGAGDDLLVGGAGNDTLDGGGGRDRIYGLAGNDSLLGKDGFVDYLDGGIGFDKASKDAADAASGVEQVS
jgi:uncharacterized delta-60 repeat protein